MASSGGKASPGGKALSWRKSVARRLLGGRALPGKRPAVERRGRIEHPYLQSERNSHNHVRCKYFCQRNMPEQMVGEVVKIEQRQTRCSQPKGRKRPVEGAPKRRALRSHASEHPPIGPLPADNANRRKRNRQQPRQRRLPRPGAIHEEHCEKRARLRAESALVGRLGAAKTLNLGGENHSCV